MLASDLTLQQNSIENWHCVRRLAFVQNDFFDGRWVRQLFESDYFRHILLTDRYDPPVTAASCKSSQLLTKVVRTGHRAKKGLDNRNGQGVCGAWDVERHEDWRSGNVYNQRLAHHGRMTDRHIASLEQFGGGSDLEDRTAGVRLAPDAHEASQCNPAPGCQKNAATTEEDDRD